jgi:Zn finger protein HypA/HybF involved in hydrogenase expression
MNNTAATTTNAERFKVKCNECGKTWWVRRYADICPTCGGADIDVAEDQ